jgi:hypothetical protein
VKLKRKAILALGALAAEALKHPKVRKALHGLAENGVKKAGELLGQAAKWWEEQERRTPVAPAEGKTTDTAGASRRSAKKKSTPNAARKRSTAKRIRRTPPRRVVK